MTDINQKIVKLLNADLHVALDFANDVEIYFQNEKFELVEKYWRKCYNKAMRALSQTTTENQAAFCTNLIIAAQLAIISFDSTRIEFVPFIYLSKDNQKFFAEMIIKKIAAMRDQFDRLNEGPSVSQPKVNVTYFTFRKR
jgi:hypothetical protein